MAASQAASRIQVDARMPNQRLHIVRHATTMAEAQHVETRMPFLPRQQSSIKFHVLRDNRLAAKQSLLTVQCLAWRMVMDLTCVRRCCRVLPRSPYALAGRRSCSCDCCGGTVCSARGTGLPSSVEGQRLSPKGNPSRDRSRPQRQTQRCGRGICSRERGARHRAASKRRPCYRCVNRHTL